MGDSRLRELERRWQEAETPATWTAYLREQLRTGTGVVPAAEAFLEGCLAFAETLAPDWRALMLSYVAWGYLDLGQEEQALALAKAAEGETDSLVGCAALTRVAAVVERVQGRGAERFDAALRNALLCLENDDGMGPRHFVQTLLPALEDAFPHADPPIDRGLLRDFLEAIPLRLIVGFGEAVQGLKRLGMGNTVGRIRTLLDPEIRAEHWVVSERPHFERLFVSSTIGTLLLLGQPDDASRAFALVREDPEQVDVSSVTALHRAFSVSTDPVGVAMSIRREWEFSHVVPWAWLCTAFLEWSANCSEAPPCASDWLEDLLTLAATQELEGPRIVQRVVPLLAALWPRERIASWTRQHDLDDCKLLDMVELLGVVARALPSFGTGAEVQAGLVQVIDDLASLVEDREAFVWSRWILRALTQCAETAGKLGVPEVCDRIEALVEVLLERPEEDAVLDVGRLRIQIAITRASCRGKCSALDLRSVLSLRDRELAESEGWGMLGAELATQAQALSPGHRAVVGRQAIDLVQLGIPVQSPQGDDDLHDAVEALGALCRDLVGMERSA